MDEQNKIARIIESESDGIKTKILEIEFPYENDIKALFTPKLENIGFIAVDKIITVNLKNPTFREQFNDWTERFLEKINSNDSSEILIEKFNNEINIINDDVLNIDENKIILKDSPPHLKHDYKKILRDYYIEVAFKRHTTMSFLMNSSNDKYVWFTGPSNYKCWFLSLIEVEVPIISTNS